MAHWLSPWRVQLPVNKNGQRTGKSLTWNPDKNFKPWYRSTLSRQSVYLKVPDEPAATTSPGRAPRTELTQRSTWNYGRLKAKVTLQKIGGPEPQTIMQVRHKGGSDEIVQVRVFPDRTLQVRGNPSLDILAMVPYAFEYDKGFWLAVKVRNGEYIQVKLHDEVICRVPMAREYPDKSLHFKFGLYGRGGGKGIFRYIKW